MFPLFHEFCDIGDFHNGCEYITFSVLLSSVRKTNAKIKGAKIIS